MSDPMRSAEIARKNDTYDASDAIPIEGAEGLDGDVLAPDQGRTIWLGGLGVRLLIGADSTEGRFSLIEHLLKPGALASPSHTHSREDEFSVILEGSVGFQLGDRELVATPGSVVFKPRDIPHAFWNAGPTQARLLELISPAGLEEYFVELAESLASPGGFDPAAMSTLADRYGMRLDLASVSQLRAKHGLLSGRARE